MYTLYYIPDACSLAIHTLLLELGQAVTLIHKASVPQFETINPTGQVPVLDTGAVQLREGAAIILYLLNQHPNPLLPINSAAPTQKSIQQLLFANANMHPAYSRLFFLAAQEIDNAVKLHLQQQAALAINRLWQVVEDELHSGSFLGGNNPSAADLLLAVYSRWGEHFPVDIVIGPRATAMIQKVIALPSFQQALAAEHAAKVAA